MANVIAPIATSFAVGTVSRLLNPGQSTTQFVKREANRIEDLGAPDSSYGYPIRELLGVCRVDGCSLIWAQPLREEITTSVETQTVTQGKGMGGSRQTTVTETETATYYMTGAFLIGGRINRLQRVWANGVEIYNRDTSGEIIDQFGAYTELYYGAADQAPSPTIAYYEGAAPALRGYSYIVFDDYPIQLYKGSGFPKIDVEVYGLYTSETPQLRLNFVNAFKHITSLAGINESEVDISATPDVVMFGAVFENNGESYASYIQDLAFIHNLEYKEERGKLYIYNKTNPTSAIELPLESLGTRLYGEALPDLYQKKKLDPIALPSEVRVEFISKDKELNRNNVFYKDPNASHTKADRVTTRIVTNEADMARRAANILYQAKTESQSIEEIYLAPCWAGIGIGDFIGIQEKDVNRVYRVIETYIGDDYRVKVKAIGTKATFRDDGGSPVFDSSEDPDVPVVTDYPVTPPVVAGTAELECLDIALARDTDSDGTLYIAVKGDANWFGGGIYLSRDAGASYQQVASIAQSSITGDIALATPAGSGLDTTTVITVTNVTEAFSSVTQAQFDLGNGILCLIGDEIVMARDAVLTAPGTYEVSYLQRGMRGTEWAAGGHGAGERFVVLSGPIVKVRLRPEDIGQTLRFKAVGLYASEPAVTAYTSILLAGVNWKPYAPESPAGTKDQGGNITLTWARRDRHGAGQSSDFPESYQVLIYDGPTLVRTLNSTSQEVSYTAAQQVTDFGSVQSSVSVVIQQWSYIVGWGYPLTAVVTPTLAAVAPVITAFSPTQGQEGDAINIYGAGFTGAVGASINGTALDSFVVISDTLITGMVGAGTTTGKVEVGTTQSIGDFVIFTPSVNFADIGGFARDNADLDSELDGKEDVIIAGTTSQYWRGDKSWQTLDKSAVGLGNVDNTSDISKPISTATQTALDAKLGAVPFGGLIETIANKTYPLFTPDRSYKIKSLRVKSESGTCTWAIQIAGVNVTGLSSISVSSVESLTLATGGNTVASGQRVTIVSTANASALNVEFTIMLETV